MAERNDLLRAARLRSESPGSPGRPMTRQELADAINAHTFRSTGKRAGVTANHVGKWERGETRWPTTRYRAALRAVLDAATDAELGFQPPERVTVDSVDRKTFLKTSLGVGAAALLAHDAPTTRADYDLVEAIAGPTASYRRMESTVPSEQLALAVDAHLGLVTGVVRTRLRKAAGFRVLAETAGLSAWLAADRGSDRDARRRYAEAIRYAERTHHPLLVTYMTASLGHFAVESGNPRSGLDLVRRAESLLGADTPDAANAWIACLYATAHATMKDRVAAMQALRHAQALANRERGDVAWPWVFPFDQAKVARYEAGALARLGELRAAAAAYEAADVGSMAPKPRALVQIEQASVRARSGDVAGGCALAVDALDTGLAFGSERITHRVQQFRGSLPPTTKEAVELDQALARLYDKSAL